MIQSIVDGVALWVTSLVTHSFWCLWLLTDTCAPDTVITHSVCHSHSSPSRGVWPLSVEAFGRALCLVRVPYIRTRTSPSHSRAPRSLSLVGGSLSLSLSLSHTHLSIASSPSPVSPPSVLFILLYEYPISFSLKIWRIFFFFLPDQSIINFLRGTGA